MDTTDYKFGLPQPDFKALPKKKIIWPILLIVAIIVLLITAKMGYRRYIKLGDQKNASLLLDRPSNGAATDQLTDASSTPSASPKEAHSSEMDTNVHGGSDQLAGTEEAFQHKKNTKIQESISATQKQLALKQNKPLVRPGTYQVLKEPQGIYHLVVLTHLDKSFAIKLVQQLMKQKQGVCLILPRIKKGEKYYRVTIAHSRTQYEAEQRFKQFKPKYPKAFILKY